MTRSAYIDLEFRSKLVGFDEVESKIDKLLSKLDKLSSISGEINVASGRTRSYGSSNIVSEAMMNRTVETAIVNGFSDAVNRFTQSFSDIGKDIPTYYVDIAGQLEEGMADTIEQATNLLTGEVDKGYIDLKPGVDFAESPMEEASRFDINKIIENFGSMVKKFGGAAIAIKLFTNLIKTIVEQSQVFQAMVQLVFHPFVMMVNFMLLPVLKWLIPVVSDWLKWVIENKEGLDAIGDILTDIGDAVGIASESTTNPFKEFVEMMTSMSKIEASDLTSWEKFAEQLKTFVGFDTTIFSNPLLSATGLESSVKEFVNGILSGFADAITSTIETDGSVFDKVRAFFIEFFTSLGDTIKNVFLERISNIPLIGEDLRDMIEGTTPSVLSEDTSGVSTIPTVSPTFAEDSRRSNNMPNYEFILMNETPTDDNVHRVMGSMQSIWRAKLNYI